MYRESWFTRLRGSGGGIFIGLVMIVTSVPLLFLNEGRAVKTARSLDEGAAVVIHVSPSPVQAIHEGKLVHFNGPAVTQVPLRDTDLGIEVKALQLVRKVEMYQWEERHQSRTNNENPANYDYVKKWSDQLLSSNAFRNQTGHVNPAVFPFPARTLAASDVSVGDFQVPQRVITNLGGQQTPLVMDEETLARAPRGGYRSAWGGQGTNRPQLDGGGFYYGADSQNPQVGDTRVRFTTLGLSDLSVIGRQSGHSVEPFHTRAGRDLEMAEVGMLGPQEMFEGAMRSNTFTTWFARFAGFVEMFLGITLMFRPVAVLGQLVPLAGSLIDAASALLAFGIASVVSLVVIALGWFVYRPLLSFMLLVLGGGIAVAVGMARQRVRLVAVSPPPPLPPPLPPPMLPPPMLPPRLPPRS